MRERSDFPGVEALATLKRQCLSPRCSDELASKSRVSSRRAGSAKTVGELTSIPKGLVFKRAGGYLGQHGHPVNFKSHFGRGLPERPWAYPIDPAHTQRIDLMMMVLGSLGTSPWFHIYMFEDANPYSAAQTNSEGLTTPLCRRVTRATTRRGCRCSSTSDVSLADVRPRPVLHGRQVRLPKCPGQTARDLPR